jgi:transposase
MRRKRADITPLLSTKVKAILTTYSTSRTLPMALVQRATIILLAASGSSNREIAVKVNLHYNQVGLWRNRFLAFLPTLQALEACGAEALAEELMGIFSDKPRAGAPSIFTAEQVIRIVDLACKPPEDYGYEVSHWSYSLLAEAIIALGITCSISRSSVYRFLKSGRYTPA